MLREETYPRPKQTHVFKEALRHLAEGKILAGKEADEVSQGMMRFKAALDVKVSWTLPTEDAVILSNDKSHAGKHLMLLITPSSLKDSLPLDSRMLCCLLFPIPLSGVFVPLPRTLPILQYLQHPRAQAWFFCPFPEALLHSPAELFTSPSVMVLSTISVLTTHKFTSLGPISPLNSRLIYSNCLTFLLECLYT